MMGPQGLTGLSLLETKGHRMAVALPFRSTFVFGHVDTSFHDLKTCNGSYFPEHFTSWCSGYADEEDVKVCFFFIDKASSPCYSTCRRGCIHFELFHALFPLLGVSGFLWSADKFATQWLASWILFFVSEIAFWRLSLYSPSKRIFCSWDHDWNDDWNDDWTGLAIFIALCFALSHAIDCLQLLEAKSLSFSETSMDGISLMTFVPRFHGTGYNSEYSHDLDLSSDCLTGSGFCMFLFAQGEKTSRLSRGQIREFGGPAMLPG